LINTQGRKKPINKADWQQYRAGPPVSLPTESGGHKFNLERQASQLGPRIDPSNAKLEGQGWSGFPLVQAIRTPQAIRVIPHRRATKKKGSISVKDGPVRSLVS
jgi:hypothetical protein